MLNFYETGGVPPHQMDVMNKCQQCGATWIGSRRELCTDCTDKLGCRNIDCNAKHKCWRFLHGEGDGQFDTRLYQGECDWFKSVVV